MYVVGDSKGIVEAHRVGKKLRIEFFTSKVRLAFVEWGPAFSIALIIYHLNSEYHFWIETNVSSKNINRILSLIILKKSDSRQSITFNGKVFAIIKKFKCWRNNLKTCKHKLLFLMDYNKL